MTQSLNSESGDRTGADLTADRFVSIFAPKMIETGEMYLALLKSQTRNYRIQSMKHLSKDDLESMESLDDLACWLLPVTTLLNTCRQLTFYCLEMIPNYGTNPTIVRCAVQYMDTSYGEFYFVLKPKGNSFKNV